MEKAQNNTAVPEPRLKELLLRQFGDLEQAAPLRRAVQGDRAAAEMLREYLKEHRNETPLLEELWQLCIAAGIF